MQPSVIHELSSDRAMPRGTMGQTFVRPFGKGSRLMADPPHRRSLTESTMALTFPNLASAGTAQPMAMMKPPS